MAIPINGRIFLTDGVMRRTLAAARALGREGLTVTCGEESTINLTFFSRYCHHRFKYPSPRERQHAFVASLLHYLEENPHECLLPMEQDTLDIILQDRHQFERLTRLPLADNKTYQIFRDKGKTIELARQVGVPYPRTALPTSPDHVMEETRSFRFPVVIKPRHGWASRGIRYVQEPGQLLEAYRQAHEEDPLPLVQERIPRGEKYNVNCLFDRDARPLATCAQRELRNYPLEDGVSTVQESVWRPDLVDMTVQLLQANHWYGVANVDYMIDPRDGTPMLMEVNPRFWGSLQMSIQCGINFPHLLCRLARGEKVEPVHKYAVGVMCRALLPYDILHFFANPHRWQMKPGFFDFFNPRIRYHILSTHDWMPILGFFLSCARYALDPEMWMRMIHVERYGQLISKLSRKRIASPTVLR